MLSPSETNFRRTAIWISLEQLQEIKRTIHCFLLIQDAYSSKLTCLMLDKKRRHPKISYLPLSYMSAAWGICKGVPHSFSGKASLSIALAINTGDPLCTTSKAYFESGFQKQRDWNEQSCLTGLPGQRLVSNLLHGWSWPCIPDPPDSMFQVLGFQVWNTSFAPLLVI